MKYRKLGSSELVVSEIALGTWLNFNDSEGMTRAASVVRAALDHGITLFDTANVYGQGAAETSLAHALRGVPRDRYVLATKLFFPMSPDDRGLSRAQVLKQLEGSLRRLGTDHIDLYQCHRFDPQTPLAETMEALTEVVRQGKVRAIGFSEWSPDNIRAAIDLSECEAFVSSQPCYSMLCRDAERETIPLCAAHGISQIAFSPLAQGLLTGKYRPAEALPAGCRAAEPGTQSVFPTELLQPGILDAIARVTKLAAEAGLTMAQLALAWLLRKPEVASAIIGSSRPEQVVENVGAIDQTVDPTLLAEAERVINRAVRQLEWEAFIRSRQRTTP